MAALACDIKIKSVSYDGYIYKILCIVRNTGTAYWTQSQYHLRAHVIESDQGVVLDAILADDSWILPNDVSPGGIVEMELHVPSGANSSIWGYRDHNLIVDMVFDADVILEGGQWFRNGTAIKLDPYFIPNVFTDSEPEYLEVGQTISHVTFDFTIYQLVIQVAEDCTSNKIIYFDENGDDPTVNSFEIKAGDIYTFTRKIDKDKGIKFLGNNDQIKVKLIGRR